MTTAIQAFAHLDPQGWATTSLQERLCLLETVRERIKDYASELAQSDGEMKNQLMGEALFSEGISMMSTVIPIANTLTACIHLYEALLKGEMPKPVSINQITADIYDVEVQPLEIKERMLAGSQKFHLRVKGQPQQIHPMEQPAGVTVVLGAGNYSSALEMVKAIFLDNKTVIHKPHHLNEKTDAIWKKVFQPLVDKKVMSFCDANQGEALVALEGIAKIYFTGGANTAKTIMQQTDTPLIAECGGNNPCIIVPGDRDWTAKEIEHQAIQIITMSKLNGGAVCGRVQSIITSKHWKQRDEFLQALEKVIVEQTPAMGTYYPHSDTVMEDFKSHYPDAKVLKPENGQYQAGDFLFITDVKEDGYAVNHEAFCQIINEIPLDIDANAQTFLPKAVEFCNNKLLGSLGSAILIDEDTKKAHQATLDQAITDLNYGAIAINTMPPFIFLSPYLTWGGNEEGKELVSGSGNFGNVYCFQEIEKSILIDKFISPAHMLVTNKAAFDNMTINMSHFAMSPSWGKMMKLVGGAMLDGCKGKDF